MMNGALIAQLNARYGAAGRIAFREGEGGFPVVQMDSRYGACELSLYGAHLLTYRPVGHGPVLYLSPKSAFEAGKAIRGGIPICWPWFGKREGKPSHGFARTSRWTLVETAYTDAYTELTLGLKDSPETRAMWPYPFEVKYVVRLGDCLKLSLSCANTGDAPMPVTQAFHPYFRVRDVRQVRIAGLEHAACHDYLTGNETVCGEGDWRATGPTDARFSPKANGCVIHDDGLGRKLTLLWSGTRSLVVWNPWETGERAIADLDEGAYTRFLCVEPVCTGDDAVTLPPGGTATLTLAIQSQMSG